MIILDTNVVSALMGHAHGDAIADWLDRQAADSLWTTTITVYEVRFGLETLAVGRRRRSLEAAFERWLEEDLGGRILSLDTSAANHAAVIAAHARAAGRPVGDRDILIAGIVVARRGTLATRNTRHFEQLGENVVNPWDDD